MGKWFRCDECGHFHNEERTCAAITATGPCGCTKPRRERTEEPWTPSFILDKRDPTPKEKEKVPRPAIIPVSQKELDDLRRQLPILKSLLANLKTRLEEITAEQKTAQRTYQEIADKISAYERGVDSVTTRAMPTSELDL
jgi:DNA-directed RNA polymerase specialized sigma24 family protein